MLALEKNHGEVHSSYFIHQEMEMWVFNAQNDTDNTISEWFSMKVLVIYEPGTIFNVQYGKTQVT